MPSKPRWWYCRECLAINDGGEEGFKCWNCNLTAPRRDNRNFPWTAMGRRQCPVCHRFHVTWTLPADTYLRGEPFTIGYCPFYFEEDHQGPRAYTEPMLGLWAVLRANGYHYSERAKRPVKNLKAKKRSTVPQSQ
jgi:hypothetical protein